MDSQSGSQNEGERSCSCRRRFERRDPVCARDVIALAAKVDWERQREEVLFFRNFLMTC
jgi:hypothetical protein